MKTFRDSAPDTRMRLALVALMCVLSPSIALSQQTESVARPPNLIRESAQAQHEAKRDYYFNEHVQRADVIATAVVGAPIQEAEGEYPNGETETMLRVPLTLKQIHKGARPAPSVDAFLNLSREKLAPGAVAVVFLRRTPSGQLFVLDAVVLKHGVMQAGLQQKLEGALR